MGIDIFMEPLNQSNFFPRSNSAIIPIITSIVLTAIVVGGGVYWWCNQKQAEVETQSNSQASREGVKDVHRWNTQPVEVKDLNLAKGLFGMPDGYVKAWDVGTYVDGYGIQSQLNGARILLVAFRDPGYNQGPFGTEPTEACDSLARIFIFRAPSGNSFVVYDPLYSPSNILAKGIRFISKDRYPVNANAQFYYKIGKAVIPSLDFPGFVVHDGKTFVLQRYPFPCYVVDAQGKTKIFFDDIKDSLQPAGFNDPMLGTAYVDKSEGGIVFRASDGTYIRYQPL
jgi:hypothetical protein